MNATQRQLLRRAQRGAEVNDIPTKALRTAAHQLVSLGYFEETSRGFSITEAGKKADAREPDSVRRGTLPPLKTVAHIK